MKDNLFAKGDDYTAFGESEMNENDMDLLQKEVELMRSEYPKHPDFAKRLASTLRDNARFRALLEN